MGVTSGNTIAEAADLPALSPAVCLQAGSGVVANAIATASLAAQSDATLYLSGVQVTGAGATSAATVTLTLTGLKGGTLSYVVNVPAGANAAAPNLLLSFYPALPASAANSAITASLPAFGAGNTAASVNLQGFFVPLQI